MTPDEALMALYQKLRDRAAPAPGSFSLLSDPERREYYRLRRRQSRAREKASAASGALEPNLANIRHVLADAALMILAVDAPGADLVREVLAEVFSARPGIPLTVQQRARTGKLRPKFAARKDQRS